MTTLKIRGLFASLALSALFMVGSAATAHANETDKEKEKKNQPKVEAKTLAPQWYVLQGTNPNDATQYAPLNPEENPEPDCEEGNDVCAIKAMPGANPAHPDATELSTVLSSNSPSSFNPNEIRFKD